MDPIRHLLVALDFHGPSLRGLDYAAHVAQSTGAHLTLVHACSLGSTGYGPDAPLPSSREELHAAGERDLQRLADILRARGLDVAVVVEEGTPADAILRVAKATEADLLVLGTHGRRGLARVVLGSVAEQVVRRAAIPVVTLHEWHFENRTDAAARLAKKLAPLAGDVDLTIATTRGAVELAIAAAEAIHTRVETFLVESVTAADGSPLGAVAEDGAVLLDEAFIAAHNESPERVASAREDARATAQNRAGWLRTGPQPNLTGYSVLLVTDSLTTPTTARLAARCARRMGARRVTLAVPVCAASVVAALPPDVERTVCVDTTHLESPSARAYREASEPTNIAAAEMLVHAAAHREATLHPHRA